ncbi:hypothetical protein EON63_14535 [archaeon]|nr:MAG: hypothetical protein EON63_14535 [archaeon]
MSGEGTNKAPDFELPMASVSRVIKAALPDNISVTKDARTALARASGVFVFYLTHAANEISRESKRQTILTSDVTKALRFDKK